MGISRQLTRIEKRHGPSLLSNNIESQRGSCTMHEDNEPQENIVLARHGDYAVSFALVAVADRWPGRGLMRGYQAALFSIWLTLGENPLSDHWLFHDSKLEYVSLLISGLINPLFIVILILAAKGYQRAIATLRIILLLMIPFCWVVLFYW